jgi:integrase/recombinase XerD
MRSRSLWEAKDDWLASISHLSPNTQRSYRVTLNELAKEIPNILVGKLETKTLQNFINKKLWGRKKTSVNAVVIAIKSFGRFISETYGIPNPAEKIKKFKPDIIYQPFITKEQYELILSKCTPRQSDIIKMLANGGFRVHELCGLDWRNISENLTTITFQGKCRKIRTIGINKTMREVISRYSKDEPLMHLPKSTKSIYTCVRRAGEKADIYLRPHMLRRYFASRLLEKGVSLIIISKLLGHFSVAQTEQYLKIDNSYLYGATDVLD